jgi:nitrogen fixation NifU-like protein
MSIEALYQEIILDHYKNPHHKSLHEPYGVEVHHNNPSCGDEVTLRLSVIGEVVENISWNGVGCSISQARTSIMCDLLKDKMIAESLEMERLFLELMQSKGNFSGDVEVLEDAVALSGVAKYPARVKCALLGWMAFRDAALRITGTSKSGE